MRLVGHPSKVWSVLGTTWLYSQTKQGNGKKSAEALSEKNVKAGAMQYCVPIVGGYSTVLYCSTKKGEMGQDFFNTQQISNGTNQI